MIQGAPLTAGARRRIAHPTLPRGLHSSTAHHGNHHVHGDRTKVVIPRDARDASQIRHPVTGQFLVSTGRQKALDSALPSSLGMSLTSFAKQRPDPAVTEVRRTYQPVHYNKIRSAPIREDVFLHMGKVISGEARESVINGFVAGIKDRHADVRPPSSASAGGEASGNWQSGRPPSGKSRQTPDGLPSHPHRSLDWGRRPSSQHNWRASHEDHSSGGLPNVSTSLRNIMALPLSKPKAATPDPDLLDLVDRAGRGG